MGCEVGCADVGPSLVLAVEDEGRGSDGDVDWLRVVDGGVTTLLVGGTALSDEDGSAAVLELGLLVDGDVGASVGGVEDDDPIEEVGWLELDNDDEVAAGVVEPSVLETELDELSGEVAGDELESMALVVLLGSGLEVVPTDEDSVPELEDMVDVADGLELLWEVGVAAATTSRAKPSASVLGSTFLRLNRRSRRAFARIQSGRFLTG